MTRTISILLVLLRLCSAATAESSVLRGTRQLHRSSEHAEDKLVQKQHRFLQKEEEFTLLIPPFVLDQTIDTSKAANSFAFASQEKADDVPARLSKNEFVFTADAVKAAGGGDIDEGAQRMYNVMKNLEAGGEISQQSQGQA